MIQPRMLFAAHVIVFAIALSLGANSAEAQGIASGSNGQSLVFHASGGAGYDDDLLAADSTPTLDPRLQQGGPYGTANLGLKYSAEGRRVTFGGSANTAFRHYRASKPFTSERFSGGAGIAATVTPRVRLNANIFASRQSHYLFWQFPVLAQSALGDIALPSFDYRMSATPGNSYQSSVELAYSPTRRSTVTLNYGRGQSKYGTDVISFKMESWEGRFNHGLTRYATLRLGYSVQEADYGEVRKLPIKTIDAGVDYSRPLSLTRRTTVKFGAGSAQFDDGTLKLWTVTGHANLDHALARTWNLNASYSRGVEFVQGFADPIYADSVALGIAGNVTRDIYLSGMTAYSNGNIGRRYSAFQDFRAYTAVARVQFALTRRLAAFSEYLYYRYNFDSLVGLPGGASSRLNRQGAHAGLELTIPVL